MTDDDRLDVLHRVIDGFKRRDADAIVAHFAEDCVFETPRGTTIDGTRIEGRDAIRDFFANRFATIPDVEYLDDTHFVSGDRGLTEFTTRGTLPDGDRLHVRACDVWTFDAEGRITRKDSFAKVVEPA
jgi:ketosteroid isomerase-like protein